MIEPCKEVRHALVLAADAASWMRPADRPRALLGIEGQPLLERLLDQLSRLGFESCSILTGDSGDTLASVFGRTHNGISLRYFGSDDADRFLGESRKAAAVQGGCLYVFRGDLICDECVVKALVDSKAGSAALVSDSRRQGLGAQARIRGEGLLEEVIGYSLPYDGQSRRGLVSLVGGCRLTGIYLDRLLASFSCQTQGCLGSAESFTTALNAVCLGGKPQLHAVRAPDRWHLIEEAVDLEAASFIFASAEERRARIDEMYGGYWRIPMTEHVLLCNIYFPPEDLLRHVAQRLHDLIALYPSGQRRMASEVADLIGQKEEAIAVGNGVSELIRALYGTLQPVVAIPTPSFVEYLNALPSAQVHSFHLPAPNFDLDVGAFAAFARAREATAAVVVNPNNPTGRLIAPDDVLKLADLLAEADCDLIVDESFIDFTDSATPPSVEKATETHANLIVLKSLGKIYGLGGIRLGYLMSGKDALVERVRKALPIWNINGIAEYILSLLPMYRSALNESCRQMRADRLQLHGLLSGLDGFGVLASQTNYLFCKLPEHWPSGPEITERLLREHGILIRNCAYQSMPEAERFIRVAARTPQENQRLADCLRDLGEALAASGSGEALRPAAE